MYSRINKQNSVYSGGSVQRGEMAPQQFSEQHDDSETGDPSGMHSCRDDSIAAEGRRRRGEGSPEERIYPKKMRK